MWSAMLPILVVWFFLYWILGGIIFSLLIVFGMRRVHKARFGCLFSFASLGMAFFAARIGWQASVPLFQACVKGAGSAFLRWIEQMACGIVGIVGYGILGFFFLLLMGWGLFLLSRNHARRFDGVKVQDVKRGT